MSRAAAAAATVALILLVPGAAALAHGRARAHSERDTGGPPADESDEAPGAAGEPAAAELARAVQNPVADLISVPFQNNFDYDIGPFARASYTLNIQPVIPTHLDSRWMIITRLIAPVVYQPVIDNTGGGTSGIGDLDSTFWLSPAVQGRIIWGVGPVFLFPTATQISLGSGKWGIGPSAVFAVQTRRWTVGALANNIWSYAGLDDRPGLNQLLLQYFVNYNLPDAWYLTSSPIVTANWKSDDWVVPFGAGLGKIFHLGKVPLNGQVAGYYNVIRPDAPPSPTWQLRVQVAFLFPTAAAKPKASPAVAAHH